LVQVASGFDADVEVSNRTTGRGPVSARSLNAVATLGVARGNDVEVTAVGPEAGAAIEAIGALAGRSFDEQAAAATTVPPRLETAPAERQGALRGLAASPGIALGPARRFHVPDLQVPDRVASDPAAERRALDEALEAAREDVERQRAVTAQQVGGYEATIFEAHLLFLRDDSLIEPARAAIAGGGRSAAAAWRDAVTTVASSWESLSDEYLRARVEDLRSVGRQVLARILGMPLPAPSLDGPGILVAADLAPAEVTALNPTVVQGIATAFGAPTSHAAVIARALAIPAVVGVGADLLAISDGEHLALDASAGLVYVDPSSDVRADLEAARETRAADLRDARAEAGRPASTSDGESIEVAVNVGSPQEIPAAIEQGADGVGLFRTELLFLEAGVDTEDAQEDAYRRAALALDGRPLTIRTLDAGADKPVPGLEQPTERNPFLGVRGVRLGLARPDLLETQLRAILRVARDHPLRVMFPMVATLDELRGARDALDRAGRAVGGAATLDVGIMVEVPAAALTAEVLAPEVDFLSIGTNDLTQYTLAADRGDPRLASLADPLHPAVLRLIRHTVEAARANGRWVGVCGELAGDPDATALLVGLGVRELSMNAPAIPLVKRAVRATDAGKAAELAREAMTQPTASAVRALIARRT
jgi:phosphocarrier protein FPr